MTRERCTKAWCESLDRSSQGRCWLSHDSHAIFTWGRCRSGKRWFWYVWDWRGLMQNDPDYYHTHGWVDTEAEARDAAIRHVRQTAGDTPVRIHASHTGAQEELKRANRQKRKERMAANPSKAKDGTVIEYLYAAEWSDAWDDGSHWGMPREWRVYRFPIIRKTKQRIYYSRKPERIDSGASDFSGIRDLDEESVGYIDRQKFEKADTTGPDWGHTQAGEIRTKHYYSKDYHLFAEPPPKPVARTTKGDILDANTLRRLKEEMAAAHPDKGGSNEAFREARARYVAARRQFKASEAA